MYIQIHTDTSTPTVLTHVHSSHSYHIINTSCARVVTDERPVWLPPLLRHLYYATSTTLPLLKLSQLANRQSISANWAVTLCCDSMLCVAVFFILRLQASFHQYCHCYSHLRRPATVAYMVCQFWADSCWCVGLPSREWQWAYPHSASGTPPQETRLQRLSLLFWGITCHILCMLICVLRPVMHSLFITAAPKLSIISNIAACAWRYR